MAARGRGVKEWGGKSKRRMAGPNIEHRTSDGGGRIGALGIGRISNPACLIPDRFPVIEGMFRGLRPLTVVSRFASILTCLLALLIASPLCCCAAEQTAAKEEKKSCCCCGGEDDGKQAPDHRCACASDDPRESPDPLLPAPPAGTNALSLEPACIWLPVALQSDIELRPVWTPAVPWHAPPARRRALLVSRTL